MKVASKSVVFWVDFYRFRGTFDTFCHFDTFCLYSDRFQFGSSVLSHEPEMPRANCSRTMGEKSHKRHKRHGRAWVLEYWSILRKLAWIIFSWRFGVSFVTRLADHYLDVCHLCVSTNRGDIGGRRGESF